LQSEVSSLEARGTSLLALTKRVQANLASLPGRELRLGQLTTDLSGLEQSYQALNQKYQTLRTSEAARVASGTQLFPARVPSQPMRRLTPINLAICIILALLIALGTASLADRVDNHVRSPRDLPIDSDLNVLAQVPYVADTSEQCLIHTKAMVSPLLENFRTLRTMLALSSTAEGGVSPRLLAVTSSVPKEGKSLVSVNLAVAAALSGERVILVDCDLRWPTLHTLCGRSNNVGFINVATGETPLEAALQTTRVPNLRVLTSGPRSTNPFHALNSRLGRELLQTLGQMADLVIIDTPPVMVLADARLTASMADSVLLVVSTEEPSKEDVVLAADLLAKSGANVAGIVLNKVGANTGYRDYYSLYPYYNPHNDTLALGAHTPQTKNPAPTPVNGNTMVPHVPSGGRREE
jgi:capsular exopolysaccharide synthesis family protein